MKIITIDREFGAGGHTVGRAVAKRLGVEFYDRDIISEAAEKSGVEYDHINAEEERVSRLDAFIKAINPISYDEKDTIFAAESAAIVKLAAKGPCVILGRCAKDVLVDAGFEVVSVFLHADEQFRLEAGKRILGTDDEAAVRHHIRKIDVERASYVSVYTDHRWNEANVHSICLSTSELGYDTCVDIVCLAAQGK